MRPVIPDNPCGSDAGRTGVHERLGFVLTVLYDLHGCRTGDCKSTAALLASYSA